MKTLRSFESGRAEMGAVLAGVAVVWMAPLARALTDYLAEMGYGRLKAHLDGAIPDGSGIYVAQVEASESMVALVYLPQAGLGTFNGVGNFSGKTFADESAGPGSASGHAANVGSYFFGNRTDPSLGIASMAPGVSEVTCFEAGDYIFDRRYDSVPDISGIKVHSHAWIDYCPDPPDPCDYDAVLREFDADVETRGFLPVVGVNNGPDKLVPELLASAYNVLSVGRSDGGHSYLGGTPATVAGAGRIKPEVMAPYSATSWATGGVSSVATLLFGVAHDTPALSNAYDQPEVIKAILMAGATKEEFYKPGYIWSRSVTAPLDARYGAGEANVYESYLILAGGEQAPGGAMVARAGWDYGAVPVFGAAQDYPVVIPSGLYGNQVSIVLTWNRRGILGVVDDLNLQLLDGGGTIEWDASRSTVDNVEHVYYRNLPAGDYRIRVSRTGGLGTSNYGLAWRTELGTGPLLELDTSAGVVLNLSQLDPKVSYTIQRSSTNFESASWTNRYTFTPARLTYQWTDVGASGARWLYRLAWTPVTAPSPSP